MTTDREKYEQWHSQLSVDVDIDTPWHNWVAAMIAKDPDFTGARVLEIGCGRGGFSLWMASHDPGPEQIVAADYSGVAVRMGAKLASEEGVTDIQWHEADIQQLPFADETFDIVISCETIEHVPDPEMGVRELTRVLKKNGTLYLTTPNYFNFFGLWRVYRYLVGRPYTEVGQPINNVVMMPRTLRWIRRCGLKLEAFGSVDLVIPRYKRPPYHVEAPTFLKPVTRWLGLQSYFHASKRG